MSARRMLAVLLHVAFGMAVGVVDAAAQGPPPPISFVPAQSPLPAPLPTQVAPVQPASSRTAPPQPAPQPPVNPPAGTPGPACSARAPSPARSGPRLSGLSAVLVTAIPEDAPSGRGGRPQLEVPAAARKALASISSFLPYKSYSMADAALVSAPANDASASSCVTPEQADYVAAPESVSDSPPQGPRRPTPTT